MGGIADGIGQGRRVEVDEDHAVAREEDVVGLEIPVDRRGRHVFQAPNNRGGHRVDLRSRVRAAPLNQRGRQLQVGELVGEGPRPRDRQVVPIERGHGSGHRARRVGGVSDLE